VEQRRGAAFGGDAALGHRPVPTTSPRRFPGCGAVLGVGESTTTRSPTSRVLPGDRECDAAAAGSALYGAVPPLRLLSPAHPAPVALRPSHNAADHGPAPRTVGPDELQRPNLGAAERDAEIQVVRRDGSSRRFQLVVRQHLNLLPAQVSACHGITGHRVQKPGGTLPGRTAVIDSSGNPSHEVQSCTRMGFRSLRRTAPSSRAYESSRDVGEVVLDVRSGCRIGQHMAPLSVVGGASFP